MERQVFHDGQDKNALDWARNGRFALFVSISPATREDIWILQLSGEGKPTPIASTPHHTPTLTATDTTSFLMMMYPELRDIDELVSSVGSIDRLVAPLQVTSPCTEECE